MKKNILIIILLAVSYNFVYAGGPWPKKKGKYYIKLSEWWVKFDKHYTDTGLTDPNVTTGIYNTYLYAEYGITDRLSGIFNGSIFSRNLTNNIRSITTNEILIPGEALNSIGDIDLGIKYGLTKPGAKVPLSLSLYLGLPTGQVGKGQFGTLQTGDGEFNQMLQLDLGKSINLEKADLYFTGYVGFNNRTKGFSEEFRYGLEAGVGLFNKKLWLNSKLQAIESFKNGETAATTQNTTIFANNTEFISISVEGNYFITKNFGVSASYISAFRGEIIAAAPSYNVGIFYNID